MPLVCHYRPVRKRQRLFRSRDIERIVADMVDRGVDPLELLAVAFIATGSMAELDAIYRKLHILQGIVGIITLALAATRIRLVFRAISLIVQAVSERFQEFPSLGDSISISGELGVIVKSVMGVIGGVVGLVKLVFTLQDSFIDELRTTAYAYLEEPPPEYPAEDELLNEINTYTGEL